MIEQWELRAAFARALSAMYGEEVPAYNVLLEVAEEVNQEVLSSDPGAERLGSIARVTAERHGAIRVGSPAELSQVARIFGALGMSPVGFYDLREAAASSVPVVSTAFRPTSADELARNPFRVFTSMLVTSDRRFFSADVQARAESFIDTRTLFAPQTLELADRARAQGGLAADDAARFLAGAVEAFEISTEPVDGPWYRQLQEISAVAADIAGVPSTHINHLTPRVLDIDELYRRMAARGVTMIDDIQGPPHWNGPDVLLRQTSFRALEEPRLFREADGEIIEASLRVRFGEVEARGIALTELGRARYDAAIAEAAASAAELGIPQSEAAGRIWHRFFPATELELLEKGIGFFTFRIADHQASPEDMDPESASTVDLVRRGVLVADPIVYEDFLPRSAAGIFQSNLTDEGTRDGTQHASAYDRASLAAAIGMEIADPLELYAAQSRASEQQARSVLRRLQARA